MEQIEKPMEKLKVNLTYRTYQTLLGDMETFGFLKPSGEVNRNAFLNQLIEVMHERAALAKEIRRQTYQQALDEAGMGEDSSPLAEALSGLEMPLVSLTLVGPLVHSFSFRPEERLQSLFLAIEENELDGSTLSAYFRSLFDQYALLPGAEREALFFQEAIAKTKKAIHEGRKLILLIGKGKSQLLSPVGLAVSRDGEANFLLGYNEKGKLASYHLYKLGRLSLSKEGFLLSQEEIEEAKKVGKTNPSFVAGGYIEAKVKMNKEGRRLYRSIKLNRPEIVKEEGDVFTFEGDAFQLFSHFNRFGASAIVLSPKDLRQKLLGYYRWGLSGYKKSVETS